MACDQDSSAGVFDELRIILDLIYINIYIYIYIYIYICKFNVSFI